MMKIPIMSYAINLTFWLLVWLVPGEKFYGLGTGFQFQTIPVPLYVLNPMGLLWFPVCNRAPTDSSHTGRTISPFNHLII